MKQSVTRKQSNLAKVPRTSKQCKYIGVSRQGRKYCARTHVNKVKRNLGTYRTEEDAAFAYQAARHFGVYDRDILEAVINLLRCSGKLYFASTQHSSPVKSTCSLKRDP